MTENVSTQQATEQVAPETINLESIGIAFVIAWFAMVLWSPVFALGNECLDIGDAEMHLLRLVMLIAVCIVYAIVQFFPHFVQRKNSRLIWLTCGVALSPWAALSFLIPAWALILAGNIVLRYLVWAAMGVSVAIMMFTWGYDVTTKTSYKQGALNIAFGAIFSGAFFIVTSFVQARAAVVLTLILPFAVYVLWVAHVRRHGSLMVAPPDAEEVANAMALTSVRRIFRRRTSLFIFSYGFVMGFMGSFGTQAGLAQYAVIFVGVSTLAAGVFMIFTVKLDLLMPTRHVFMLFLPFSAVCIFLASLDFVVLRVVVLFAVYFVVNVCNVMNTAFFSTEEVKGQEAWTEDLFTSESRTADMVGSSLGWAIFIVGQFAFVSNSRIYFHVCLILVLVCMAAAAYDQPSKAPQKPRKEQLDRKQSLDIIYREWENACRTMAEKYKLSPRETEIFILLSRGRDRQYIHNLLCIAPSTVRTHMYNIYQKLGVHNQQGLIDAVETEFLGK